MPFRTISSIRRIAPRAEADDPPLLRGDERPASPDAASRDGEPVPSPKTTTTPSSSSSQSEDAGRRPEGRPDPSQSGGRLLIERAAAWVVAYPPPVVLLPRPPPATAAAVAPPPTDVGDPTCRFLSSPRNRPSPATDDATPASSTYPRDRRTSAHMRPTLPARRWHASMSSYDTSRMLRGSSIRIRPVVGSSPADVASSSSSSSRLLPRGTTSGGGGRVMLSRTRRDIVRRREATEASRRTDRTVWRKEDEKRALARAISGGSSAGGTTTVAEFIFYSPSLVYFRALGRFTSIFIASLPPCGHTYRRTRGQAPFPQNGGKGAWPRVLQ